MPHVWIRNDFKHHLKIKLSQDKIVFDKQKIKNALGVEGNVDVGVEPINVGVGAAFNKKTEVEQEGIVFQDIQVAGFTRVEKGTEHTFAYNFDKKKLHYMTILIHTGDGNFEKNMVNQELENRNKNISVNKDGAIIDARWYHKTFNIGKEDYQEPPTSEHVPADRKKEMALQVYSSALRKLEDRMTAPTVNASLIEIAAEDLKYKWKALSIAHDEFVNTGFRRTKVSKFGGYDRDNMSSEEMKDYLDEWTKLEIEFEDKIEGAERGRK